MKFQLAYVTSLDKMDNLEAAQPTFDMDNAEAAQTYPEADLSAFGMDNSDAAQVPFNTGILKKTGIIISKTNILKCLSVLVTVVIIYCYGPPSNHLAYQTIVQNIISLELLKNVAPPVLLWYADSQRNRSGGWKDAWFYTFLFLMVALESFSMRLTCRVFAVPFSFIQLNVHVAIYIVHKYSCHIIAIYEKKVFRPPVLMAAVLVGTELLLFMVLSIIKYSLMAITTFPTQVMFTDCSLLGLFYLYIAYPCIEILYFNMIVSGETARIKKQCNSFIPLVKDGKGIISKFVMTSLGIRSSGFSNTLAVLYSVPWLAWRSIRTSETWINKYVLFPAITVMYLLRGLFTLVMMHYLFPLTVSGHAKNRVSVLV